MLRFLLAALVVVSAILALFAGAVGDWRSLPVLSSRLFPVVDSRSVTVPRVDQRQPGSEAANPRPAPSGATASNDPALKAAQAALQRQVSQLQQQVDTLQAEINERTQEVIQRNRELTQRDRDLAERAHQVAERTQELAVRSHELTQRKQEIDAARADADKLKQTVDSLREQRKTEEASLARLRSQERPVAMVAPARPAPAPPSPPPQPQQASQAPAQSAPAQSAPVARPEPAPAVPPLMPPTHSVQLLAPQQLLTARQWLASGRADDARRVLVTVQASLDFKPLMPSQPYADGGNATATAVGEAIHWLDLGATGHALQSINRAINAMEPRNTTARAGADYAPADDDPKYVQR